MQLRVYRTFREWTTNIIACFRCSKKLWATPTHFTVGLYSRWVRNKCVKKNSEKNNFINVPPILPPQPLVVLCPAPRCTLPSPSLYSAHWKMGGGAASSRVREAEEMLEAQQAKMAEFMSRKKSLQLKLQHSIECNEPIETYTQQINSLGAEMRSIDAFIKNLVDVINSKGRLKIKRRVCLECVKNKTWMTQTYCFFFQKSHARRIMNSVGIGCCLPIVLIFKLNCVLT